MPMLIVQLAILIAVAFVIGCVLGRLVKGRKAVDKIREDTFIAAALSTPAVNEKPESVLPAKEAVIEEAQHKQIEDVVEEPKQALPEDAAGQPQADTDPVDEVAVEETVIVVVPSDKPELLDAPLRGKPDDLTAINGIGKAIEDKLQKIGIFHYAQIAQWNLDEAGWIERHIGFAGRVTREDWIIQSSKLVESVSKRTAKPKKAVAKAKTATRSKTKQA